MKWFPRRLIPAFFAAFSLQSVSAAPEKQPPLEPAVPESMLKETRKIAYGIYMKGTKTGWAVISRAPGELEAKPCVIHRLEFNMSAKVLGDTLQTGKSQTAWFDTTPPYRALKLESVEKQDGQERRVILTCRNDTSYAVEIEEAGKKRTARDLTCDYRFAHAAGPEIWLTDPLRKPGDLAGWAEFEFERLERTIDTAAVKSESVFKAPEGEVPVWEVDVYDFETKQSSLMQFDKASGDLVTMTIGSLLEFRREDEAVAKEESLSEVDVLLATSIKSDRELGEADKLTDVELRLRAPAGTEPLTLPETVNQHILPHRDGSLTIRITRGKGKPQPATAAERAENLKATPRYPIEEEEFKKLAAEAVGHAADDTQKVKNLLRFTDRYLLDSGDIEVLSAMDLLKNRRGDCSAHALLFNTLARAAGIPAREASGWYYMGDDHRVFGGHAWNEVILNDRWVPVDATMRQLQLDAGHIQGPSEDSEGSGPGLVEGLEATITDAVHE